MDNSIITWYSLKKHRNHKFRFYIIFVSDLGCILASFLGPLGIIFDIFWSLIFGCFFGCILHGARHENCPQMAPQMDQQFQKKTKCMLATSIWEYSTPIRLRFGSTLVAIWDVLGISWQPFGITFGHVWSPFGHLLVII